MPPTRKLRSQPRAPRPDSIIDEEALRDSQARSAHRAALAAWISLNEWSHFATLTTRRRLHASSALGAETMWRLVQGFIRSAGRLARRGAPYIAFLERHADGESLHAHLLIEGTAQLSVAQLEALWGDGEAHVECYDPSRGKLAMYITKELLLTDHDAWRCSRRPFRRAASVDVDQAADDSPRREDIE